jgi:hypothetical protein
MNYPVCVLLGLLAILTKVFQGFFSACVGQYCISSINLAVAAFFQMSILIFHVHLPIPFYSV